MNEWLMIAGMTAVTFLPRWGTLALLDRMEMPRPLIRMLQYVPVAVLAAIIAPAMLLRDGQLYLGLDNSFLYAGIIAGVVGGWRKNLLLTIVVGMIALFVWPALIPVGM
jgi:branched-subunit amino acid transport protein